MSLDPAALLAASGSGRSAPLLLDHLAFAEEHLQRGELAWREPAAYLNIAGQAQGMFRPEGLVIDLGVWIDRRIAGDPQLRAAMGARTRTGFALKTLLADSETFAVAKSLLSAAAQSRSDALVVVLPGPAQLFAKAHAAVGNDPAAVDAGHGENAAMYLADWVGRLSDVAVSLVLLDADSGQRADLGAGAQMIEPVTNVCRHQRWDVATLTGGAIAVDGNPVAGLALTDSFWAGEQAGPASFYFTRIPAGTSPDDALARLGSLPKSGA